MGMQERSDWFSSAGTRHGERWGDTLTIKHAGRKIQLRPVENGVEVTSVLPDGTIATTIIRCLAGACAA
jgi:hypothetical protein